jgi:hypothetical protein
VIFNVKDGKFGCYAHGPKCVWVPVEEYDTHMALHPDLNQAGQQVVKFTTEHYTTKQGHPANIVYRPGEKP